MASSERAGDDVKRYGACRSVPHPSNEVGHLDACYIAICRCECHASREGQSGPTLSSQPTTDVPEPVGPDTSSSPEG